MHRGRRWYFIDVYTTKPKYSKFLQSERLGGSEGRLESVLGRLGGVLRRVGVVLGRLGVVLRCLGGVFDVSLRVLDAS